MHRYKYLCSPVETPSMHKEISDAIIRSQHCQRNWDLEQQIPKEDLDLLITAATQCPSKQNVAYYKLHVITNRDVIEQVAAQTNGFIIQRTPEFKTTINTQVLANVLIVFEEYLDITSRMDRVRNEETRTAFIEKYDVNSAKKIRAMDQDMKLAVGVAAGYLNLTAAMMGYQTGCCSCFIDIAVQQILKLENRPILMMGIGYKDPTRNRRLHQTDDFMFPTLKKQPIKVNIID